MSKELETKPSFTNSDIKAFEEYTRRIKAGAQTLLEVGQALIAVRDARLYLMSHETFDDYCKETCKFSRQRAHQLMDAASVVQALPSNLSTAVDTERKARVLKKIKPERRAEAVKKAAKNGDSSAQALEDIRKQQEEEGVVTHEPVVDVEGFPIPADLVDFFHRRKEIDDLLHKASTLATTVERMMKERDPLAAFVPQYVCNHLRAVYSSLKDSRPDILCWECNGKDHKKCRACAGTGFLSKWKGSVKKGEAKRQARLRKLKK